MKDSLLMPRFEIYDELVKIFFLSKFIEKQRVL